MTIYNQEKTYKYWDVPPVFSGCEELPGKKEKSKCSHDKLEQFLKDNVQNPGSFVKGGIRCYADASYVVEMDGTISNIKIINEKGEGVGDELLRLLSIVPPMQPGKLDSMPIRCFQWISFHIAPKGEVSLSSEIFKVVEDPPVFPGSEQIKNSEERKKCSSDRIIEYIHNNMSYPALAIENGVEGMIFVSFIIEMDGSISYSEVVRDIGAGLGGRGIANRPFHA